MTIQVKIPTQLRPIVGGASETHAAGSTVAEVIDDLGGRYPSIVPRLLDEEGRLRRFVNLYVDDEDVRFLKGLVTPVEDGCCITIIPAIAGGEDVPFVLLREFQTGAAYRQDLLQRLRGWDVDPVPGVARPAVVNEAAHEIERLEQACNYLCGWLAGDTDPGGAPRTAAPS